VKNMFIETDIDLQYFWYFDIYNFFSYTS